MITNFETHTEELTKDEMILIPLLVEGFKRYTKDNPINSGTVCTNLNMYLQKEKIDVRMTDARLRKCVNHIRKNALAPIIATSKGYYLSTDKEEIQKQIVSLIERSNSMLSCVDGLRKFL